jgi:hypothetical protein
MKTAFLLLCLLALLPAASTAQQSEQPVTVYEHGQFRTESPPSSPLVEPAVRWSGHVSYVIGYKRLETGWNPAADQVEFGLFDLDVQPPGWPVSLALQSLLSYADDIPNHPGFLGDYSGTYEFNFGVRKVFDQDPRFQPFVSGGLSVLGGSTTTHWSGWDYTTEDSDSDIGWWTSAGLYWNLTQSFHIGFQAEYSWGEIQLFNRDLNAGGFHALFMAGIHW